jgi:oxygen-independent coproporphyrinogen III oxidase
VFLGGGTPTTLDPETILSLFVHLRARFEVAENDEVTCEANPATVDERSLRSLQAAGITRLSLGVQSFDPSVLASLERVRRPGSAVRALTDMPGRPGSVT